GSHTCRKGWFLQRSEESVPIRLSLSRKRRKSTAESSADTRCDRLFHIPSAPAVQQRTDQTAGCWKRHRHLSMTVKEQIEDTELFGVEVDPLLAQVNVNLCDYLEVPMDIYPQNIIEPVRLPQVDAA